MPTSSKKKIVKSGGLGQVASAAAKTGKGKAEWLTVPPNSTFFLRFGESGKEFVDGYVHSVPMEVDGNTKNVDVMCMDQKEKGVFCPGCRDDLQRRYKFWANVIVRDWEDDSGETSDKLMIWSQGISVAKQLDKIAGKLSRKDLTLTDVDIEVEREGKTKNDTRYTVDYDPEESVFALSKADEQLFANKFDLKRYTRMPEDEDQFFTPSWKWDDDDDDDRPTRSSFARRKKTADDDDDEPKSRTSFGKRATSEDDDEDDAPSPRKSSSRRRRTK